MNKSANSRSHSTVVRDAALSSTSLHSAQSPRRSKSCFTRLPDGHYVEPFHPQLVDNNGVTGGFLRSSAKMRNKRLARSRVRDAEISATVLCVRRTSQNILVRFMPRDEWVHIKSQDEVLSVKDGRLGETSEHVVASPLLKTMPGDAAERSFSASQSTSITPLPMVSLEPINDSDDEDDEDGGGGTHSRGLRHGDSSLLRSSHTATSHRVAGGGGASQPVRYVPWSCYANESTRAADAGVSEPLVYDYFVPPENPVAKARQAKHSSITGYVKYKMAYSKHEMESSEKEYRRSYLAVERRNIFLWQLQRDLQARLHRDPTYVVGRVVPEAFVQTFFLLREEQSSRQRYEARLRARTEEEAQEILRRRPPNFFILDHTFTQLPFAGQAASDGYVVVSIGGPNTANKASLFEASDDDEDAPFVPHTYGSAQYVRAGDAPPAFEDSRADETEPLPAAERLRSRSTPATPGGDLSLSSPDSLPYTTSSVAGVVPILTTGVAVKKRSTSPPRTTVPASKMRNAARELHSKRGYRCEEQDSPLPSSPLTAKLTTRRTVTADLPRRELECSLTHAQVKSAKPQNRL